MAVYFDRSGEARCWYCWLSLRGRGSSGRCPQCNHWYTLTCARIEPSRARLVALLAARPKDCIRRAEVLRMIAVVVLAVGNAAVVAFIVWMAWKALKRAMGM